jgi:3-deoxy-D-manno-octulosonate 8-phosphate phosphatase (KDO 8-P phosphatase)
MESETIQQKAARIRMLVLDVDGTLTDGGVYIDMNGVQSRKFNIKDGMGIKLLQEKGIEVGLLSHSNMLSILEERGRMLQIRHIYAGKESKLHILHRWMNELGLQANQIAYIGDDLSDLEPLSEAGLSACPADAARQVIQAVDVVLQKKGGEGCVREFIDRFLLSSQL